MKLDDLQKDEFTAYWGRCPMVLNKEICHVESVERQSKGKYKVLYYRYFVDPTRFSPDGNVMVQTEGKVMTDLEQFEPYFVEAGFYQINSQHAAWINRRPERGRRKGMHSENTDFIGIHHINDKAKEVMTYRDQFDIKTLTRIYHGRQLKIPYDGMSLDECILRNNALYDKQGYSIALSKNVGLVSSTHEIPIVFYKMNPVGYYMDGKILLQRKKIVSTDVIKEETGLPIEIYEG